MTHLNEEMKWKAVINCEREYDGIFFYAVKSTKICCRPSCKSRTPLRENIDFFSSVSRAVQEGYRPCKRCRPDLIEPPNHDSLIEKVMQLIKQEYATALTLDKIAQQVGMSKFHLQRLFKTKTGKTPLEYTTVLRMKEATLLLQNSENTVTEIAHDLGYKSSAHFSNVFQKHIGVSPSEYRQRRSR